MTSTSDGTPQEYQQHPLIACVLASAVDYDPRSVEALIDYMVGIKAIECESDLFRQQLVDLAIKAIDARRKELNKRLLALKTAWDTKQVGLKPSAAAWIDKHGAVGPTSKTGMRNYRTELGTVTQKRLAAGLQIHDEEAAIEWLCKEVGGEDDAIKHGLLEVRCRLTPAGKDYLRDACYESYNEDATPTQPKPESPDGVSVREENWSIVNRPGRHVNADLIDTLLQAHVFARPVPVEILSKLRMADDEFACGEPEEEEADDGWDSDGGPQADPRYA